MDKQQLKNEALLKLEELQVKADAVKAIDTAILGVAETGKVAVDALATQLTDAQEALANAQDLETAREAKDTIDSLKKDIELQKAVNESLVKNKRTELEDVVTDFIEYYKTLKTVYNSLDKEVAFTINMRSLEDDEQTMSSISSEAYIALGDINRVLIKNRVIKRGVAFYKGFHLSQAPLEAYAKYRTVANKLKTSKDNLTRIIGQ